MSWTTKKLGEVCDLVKSGVDFFDGEKEYIDTGSLINGNIISFETIIYKKRPSRANMVATAGDILVAKMKDTLKVYLATEEDKKKRIFSTGFFIFKPKNNLVISKYLFFYFINPSFQDLKNSLSHGATQRAINNQDIEKYFEIPLPPLSEQKKIVAKLEGVLAKISEAKKLRVEAQENTDNLLSTELHKIFAEGKKKGWEEKELGKITEVVGGGTPSTSVNKYWGGRYAWATPKDLGKLETFEIRKTNKNITEEGLKRSSAKLLPIGSVILSSRAPIGYVAINIIEMATNQGCRSFICKKDLHNKYLFYFLRHNTTLLQSHGSGSTFSEISGSRLKQIKIPLPLFAEQKKIVARLDKLSQQIEKIKKLQTATQNEFTILEQSILSKAFKGELIK